MSTPIETADEAMGATDLATLAQTNEDITDAARAVLASLAQHRDDIARAIHADDLATGHSDDEWRDMSRATRRWYLRNADAVLAYLTGEAS